MLSHVRGSRFATLPSLSFENLKKSIVAYFPTSMSGAKAALKAINESIRGQKFDDAITQAKQLVNQDPKSYQGYVRATAVTQRGN